MEIDVKTEVKGSELAAVLGVTYQRVHQLTKDGVLLTASRGKYNLSDSIQAFMNFKIKEKPMSQAENDKLNADVVIKKAKATMMALQAKELQGKMHRSEDVAALTEDLVYTIRGMLLALPGRLAVDAAHLSDPAEVSELVRTEVYAIMTELSQYQYDSKKYEERVRERMNWDTDHEQNADYD